MLAKRLPERCRIASEMNHRAVISYAKPEYKDPRVTRAEYLSNQRRYDERRKRAVEKRTRLRRVGLSR